MKPPGSSDYDQEPEPLSASICSGGGEYLGSIRDCGFSIEALDADGVSLGMFSDQEAAADAVFDHWDMKLRSNGGDPCAIVSEEPGLPPGPAQESAALAAALGYAKRGWDVFPAPLGEKKSYKSAQYSNGAKWGKTRDPEQIRQGLRPLAEGQCRHPDRQR